MYGVSELECVCLGCETDAGRRPALRYRSRANHTQEVSYAIQCIRRRVLTDLVVVTPTPAPFAFLSAGYHLEAG